MKARPTNAALWSVVGAIAVVVVWEVVVRLLDVRRFVLLPPSQIVTGFADAPGKYLGDTATTARHLVIGLAISLVVGVASGAVLALRREFEFAAQPLLVLIMVTPWVAYVTSVSLVVGTGEKTVLFMVAFVTIPAFTYATVTGMRGADPAARELFASIDASRWEVLWRLRLPSALPSLFTAARFNVGLGLGAAYFSEGTPFGRGLGNWGARVVDARDGDALWTTILCTAMLGIAVLAVLVVAERRILRWHHSQR